MSDDTGEKTELPTTRRRQEARAQGNIARSPDLTAAVILIGMLMLLKSFGPRLVSAMELLLTEMLSPPSLADLGTAGIGPSLLRGLSIAAKALAPMFVGAVLLAVIVNILQVGFFFNAKRLQPDFATLNPVKGLGRMFGRPQTLVQLGMNVTKLLLVAWLAQAVFRDHFAQVVGVQRVQSSQVLGLGMETIYAVGIRVGLLLLGLAIVDYLYQRFRVEKNLKMSRREVQEEMRSMDGDPKVRGRRRQLAAQMTTQMLDKAVPNADVIVTDATELAVAVGYDPANTKAPRVLARGKGFSAARMREIAIASGVPIVERTPLARGMYKSVDAGQELPAKFYAPMAEILAYVFAMNGKAPARKAAV